MRRRRVARTLTKRRLRHRRCAYCCLRGACGAAMCHSSCAKGITILVAWPCNPGASQLVRSTYVPGVQRAPAAARRACKFDCNCWRVRAGRVALTRHLRCEHVPDACERAAHTCRTRSGGGGPWEEPRRDHPGGRYGGGVRAASRAAKMPRRETGAQPGATGAQPGATDAQPGATGAQPGVTGAQPGATGAQPGATGAQPGATGAQPGATGAQHTIYFPPFVWKQFSPFSTPSRWNFSPPGAPGAQPGATGAQPGAPGAQPGAPGAQPGAPPTPPTHPAAYHR
eukprot:gene9145-biopygen22688